MALIGGMVLLSMVGGLTRLSGYQTRDGGRYETYKDEFAAAEVALNKSYAHVQHLLTFGTPSFEDEVAAITAPTVEGATFDAFQITELFDGFETVTEGQWSGLNLNRLRYRIDVTAREDSGVGGGFTHDGVSLSQNLEIAYIPLYLFAIFYDPVMEFTPGPYMQVNGLVHANRDGYFQSSSGVDFMKYATVAGSIFHGAHPESGMSTGAGHVKFSDGVGLAAMESGGVWLDSTVANWTARSLDRWNGRLMDESHGITPLSLPIPAMENPHSIIEWIDPANDTYSMQQEKLEYKTSLKIIRESNGDIVGYDEFGNVVDLTYPDPADPAETKSIYEVNTFYDAREEVWVDSIDVNLANMIEGNIIPPNGILYVSNEDQGANLGVVRLINSAELPSSPLANGFTVATDDPICVQGDYNTVDKAPAMVAGDALYILSNAWNDEDSDDYSDRRASDTTVNAVCMHGIVPSANDNYSGGVENSFRFLEKWSNRTFTFTVRSL